MKKKNTSFRNYRNFLIDLKTIDNTMSLNDIKNKVYFIAYMNGMQIEILEISRTQDGRITEVYMHLNNYYGMDINPWIVTRKESAA